MPETKSSVARVRETPSILASAASALSPTRDSGVGKNLLGNSSPYFVTLERSNNRETNANHQKTVRKIKNWKIERDLKKVNDMSSKEAGVFENPVHPVAGSPA
jgi:hypothetical protein